MISVIGSKVEYWNEIFRVYVICKLIIRIKGVFCFVVDWYIIKENMV